MTSTPTTNDRPEHAAFIASELVSLFDNDGMPVCPECESVGVVVLSTVQAAYFIQMLPDLSLVVIGPDAASLGGKLTDYEYYCGWCTQDVTQRFCAVL